MEKQHATRKIDTGWVPGAVRGWCSTCRAWTWIVAFKCQACAPGTAPDQHA